jgi:hypothetical protein
MTGLKCSSSAPSGNKRGCKVGVGRATGMGQQAVVIRPGRELSLEAQPIDAAQHEQGALPEVLDRQSGCQIRRQAQRPDHLSGADLVTSWRGQLQHDLTSIRQPVWAHKPLGAVERIRHVPSDARGDTRVNADDLGATDD